jgi:uncharacterized membrane protein HdeD (DUF308 family)
MNGKLNYNDDPEAGGVLLRTKEMDLESGWLGKFFGAPSNAPFNIAGLLILLLTVSGIVVSFFPPSSAMNASDYWTKILPLITLALGYLFGKTT